MKNTVKIPKLKPGAKIQIVASSSPFEKQAFLKGVKHLESLGFEVQYRKDIFDKKYYLAGSDKRRAEELIAALYDKNSDAILFARGGYGAARLIPFLEKKKKAPEKKIVMGYSDVTVLMLYLYKRWGMPGFYGPVVAKEISEYSERQIQNKYFKILEGEKKLPYKNKVLKVIGSGKAKGIMVGGCLTLVSQSIGTPYEIETKNKILFLEDVNEKPYAIDRYLTHLKLAGKFNGVKGVIFGSLSGPNPLKHYEETLKDIFAEYLFPVVMNFPAGHLLDKTVLPLGGRVSLDTDKKLVEILELPFL